MGRPCCTIPIAALPLAAHAAPGAGCAAHAGQYRVEFNILAVVNRLTAERGAEIYDYLVTEGFDYLQFIPAWRWTPTVVS